MAINGKGLAWILIATVGFSVIPIIASMGFAENYTPVTLLFYRFFIAGIVFLIYCVLSRKKIALQDKSTVVAMCTAGGLYSIQCIFFFSAFQYISSSVGEIVYHCYPLFVLPLAAVFLHESLTAQKIFGVVLAVAGTAVILYSPWELAEIKGIVYVFVSTFTSSFYMVFTKKYLGSIDSAALTMYLCFVCAAVYFVYGLMKGELAAPTGYKAFVYIGILSFWSTIVGFFAFMKAISLLTAGQVSVFSLLEPVFTVTLAYIMLGDKLAALQIAGALVILAGIIIYDRA
ncbi:MAG: DMT family transporter [Clostridiales Family XIII bacterium]|jgi:drug/metabolite transporter (DMT)-like permease|nr:DMT family transporter [Clostridiales Family XIII bacterium]